MIQLRRVWPLAIYPGAMPGARRLQRFARPRTGCSFLQPSDTSSTARYALNVLPGSLEVGCEHLVRDSNSRFFPSLQVRTELKEPGVDPPTMVESRIANRYQFVNRRNDTLLRAWGNTHRA